MQKISFSPLSEGVTLPKVRGLRASPDSGFLLPVRASLLLSGPLRFHDSTGDRKQLRLEPAPEPQERSLVHRRRKRPLRGSAVASASHKGDRRGGSLLPATSAA